MVRKAENRKKRIETVAAGSRNGSESLPKVDLGGKVTELETMRSSTQHDLGIAKTTIEELKNNFSTSSSKINDLQNELSKSVPTENLEAVKVQLESKNADLEQKLTASKNEADELRARISRQEEKLAQSVPKNEANALEEKVNNLETTLAETRQKLALAETNGRGLESKLAESVSKTEMEAANTEAETRISELETQLSESKNETGSLREKITASESQVIEKELTTPTGNVETVESTEGIAEAGESTVLACPSCNASTFQGDMHCGNCGTLLNTPLPISEIHPDMATEEATLN